MYDGGVFFLILGDEGIEFTTFTATAAEKPGMVDVVGDEGIEPPTPPTCHVGMLCTSLMSLSSRPYSSSS